MALTKLERNKIYEAITESGLNPAEFKLTVDRAKAVIAHNRLLKVLLICSVQDRLRY